MKKLDTLMKKVDLFERLANYGDRQSFLRALGQSFNGQSDIYSQLETALKDFTAAKLNVPEIEQPLMNALSGQMDKNEVINALQNGLSGLSRENNLGQVENIQKLITSLKGSPAAPTEQPATNVITSPAKPQNKVQPASNPSTTMSLQIFLNNALRKDIIAGNRAPIKQDGILGDETKTALKEWAQNNGIGGTDIKDLINIALEQAK
jgi:hypothetical protein